MSATAGGRPTTLVSLKSFAHGFGEDEAQHEVEAFVLATRQLEALLTQERARVKKLKEEIAESQGTYQRLLAEAQTKGRDLELRHAKYKSAITLFHENEKKILSHYQRVSQELKSVRSELHQYRTAWAEVLQREREAKLIIEDGNKNRAKISELEAIKGKIEEALSAECARSEQLDRHSRGYQNELQNTLVRLHSAEAKFNELSKELDAIRLSRRSMDEEVAKIEQAMKERMTWAALKDKELIRAEIEKEAAIEREKYRESFSEIRVELEFEINRLAQELERVNRDLQRNQSESQSARVASEATLQDANARHAAAVQAAESSTASLRQEMESLKTDLRQQRDRNEVFAGKLADVENRLKEATQALETERSTAKAFKDALRLESERCKRLDQQLLDQQKIRIEAALSADEEI